MMAPLRLLPVLLLAACQMGGEGPAGVEPAATAAQVSPAAAAPAAARARPSLPVPSPRPVHALPATAAALLGADPEAVIGIFGAPLLRRSEGNAEIWLYAGPQCHLDIVFYPGEDGGAPRVAHAGARVEGDAPRGEAECLAGIARRRT